MYVYNTEKQTPHIDIMGKAWWVVNLCDSSYLLMSISGSWFQKRLKNLTCREFTERKQNRIKFALANPLK